MYLPKTRIKIVDNNNCNDENIIDDGNQQENGFTNENEVDEDLLMEMTTMNLILKIFMNAYIIGHY
jgi:hypothetical protein